MYKKPPAKKRTNTGKTTSTKKTSHISSKPKKGKVYIPAYKVIILCVSIIAICMVLLLITAVQDNKPSKTQTEPSISQRFEEPKAPPTPVTPDPEKIPAPKQEEKPQKRPTESQTSTKKNITAPTEKPKTPVTKTEPQQAKSVKKQSQPPVTDSPRKTYNFPQARTGAQLIFVFDDGGQNNAHLDKFLTLPFPITVAVLPQLTNSVTAAQKVRASGNEVMLHQPMQALNSSVNPGPGALTPDMDEAQIITQLFVNINQIGPIAGMNNHEGSAITADAEKMAIILQVASDNGIYFLDSRTNVDTQVPYVAHELGYSYYERNIFLDNEKTRENALRELKKGLDIANKNGNVIMIGHIWSADFLPDFLREVYPELIQAGYTFTTVSKSAPKR